LHEAILFLLFRKNFVSIAHSGVHFKFSLYNAKSNAPGRYNSQFAYKSFASGMMPATCRRKFERMPVQGKKLAPD
jgi:hypothetical protein